LWNPPSPSSQVYKQHKKNIQFKFATNNKHEWNHKHEHKQQQGWREIYNWPFESFTQVSSQFSS
jgi:hypothetical protein